MFYPMEPVDTALVDQRERWKETQDRQLLKEARIERPRLQERFLLSCSDLLISLGQRLQARYQSESAVPILEAS